MFVNNSKAMKDCAVFSASRRAAATMEQLAFAVSPKTVSQKAKLLNASIVVVMAVHLAIERITRNRIIHTLVRQSYGYMKLQHMKGRCFVITK